MLFVVVVVFGVVKFELLKLFDEFDREDDDGDGDDGDDDEIIAAAVTAAGWFK